MKKVDIIIPTYRPDKGFLTLLDKLSTQSYPVNRIVIMNTEEKFFAQLVYGSDFQKKYRNVEVHHISQKEFDHGNTRNQGVKYTDGDIFILMTQDAMPADEFLVEKLVEALSNERVAVAYARQLPAADCGVIETFVRGFNYPETSCLKGKEDIDKLGIKTYFCSNVCAAYRRETFVSLGGFIRCTIFNEDMIFAARAVQAGFQIAYTADARVIHSHNYTHKEQFRRNFDLGVSQADHPEIFDGIASESEGLRMVRQAGAFLWQQKKKRKIPSLYIGSACKFLGFRLGKKYRCLPKKMVLHCTMNKSYWRVQEIRKSCQGIDATKGYGRNEEKEGK